MNYFCSEKFDYAEIRLYDAFVASCCVATPHHVTLNDIKNHPVGFFNYPEIITERQQMLAGQPVAGCADACWKVEAAGAKSRRQRIGTDVEIYNSTVGIPKTVNLLISNTCNQTCVYCCKNLSSSWLNDVAKHGDYNIDGHADRYNLDKRDHVLLNVSQSQLFNSKTSQQILQQLINAQDQIEELQITGGEPFLDNNLISILEQMSAVKAIKIYTGLSVNSARFAKMLEKIKDMSNVVVMISAENLGMFHEFNRAGSKYDQWLTNFDLVSAYYQPTFNCVITNTTLFGLAEFLQRYNTHQCVFNVSVDPNFLTANMLDDQSKKIIVDQLQSLDRPDLDDIIGLVSMDADLSLRPNLLAFLQRFVEHKNLDLAIFPKSWLDWMR
jgi:organic radical activating enzyme